MRRVVRPMFIAGLALGLLVAPASAKPAEPSSPPDVVGEFEAGLVCDFAILIEEWTHTRTSVVNHQGQEKTVIVGTTRSKVTNVGAGTSTWVQSDSRLVIWEPGDGTQRVRSSGRQLFYFYPEDKSPVGVGKGLFLVRGHVKETLDVETFIVTEFSNRGNYIDICARLD